MPRGSGNTLTASGQQLLYGTRQSSVRAQRDLTRLQRLIAEEQWPALCHHLNALGPNLSPEYSPELVAMIQQLAEQQIARENIPDADSALAEQLAQAIIAAARNGRLQPDSMGLTDPSQLAAADTALAAHDTDAIIDILNAERESLFSVVNPAWRERRAALIAWQLNESLLDPNANQAEYLSRLDAKLAQGPISYLDFRVLDTADVRDMRQALIDGDQATTIALLNEAHQSIIDRDNANLIETFVGGQAAALAHESQALADDYRHQWQQQFEKGTLNAEHFAVFDEGQRQVLQTYLSERKLAAIAERLNHISSSLADQRNPIFHAFINDLISDGVTSWPADQREQRADKLRIDLEERLQQQALTTEDLAWLEPDELAHFTTLLTDNDTWAITSRLNEARNSLLPPTEHPGVAAFFEQTTAQSLPEDWGVPTLRRRWSSAEAEAAERMVLLEHTPGQLQAAYRERDLEEDDLLQPPFPAEAALQLPEVGPLTQLWIEKKVGQLYGFPNAEQLADNDHILQLAQGPEPGRERLREQLGYHLGEIQDIAGQRLLSMLELGSKRFTPREIVSEADGLTHIRYGDTDPGTLCGISLAPDTSATGWHIRLPPSWHQADQAYEYESPDQRMRRIELPRRSGQHRCPGCQTTQARWDGLYNRRPDAPRPQFLAAEDLAAIHQAARQAIDEQAAQPPDQSTLSWQAAYQQAAQVRRQAFDRETLRLLGGRDHSQVLQELSRTARNDDRRLPWQILQHDNFRVPDQVWQAGLDAAATTENNDDFSRPVSAFTEQVWNWLNANFPDTAAPALDDEQ